MNNTTKVLAAVGSLLIVISPLIFWVPFLNLAVSLAGIVLFLVGISGISNYLNEKRIFSDALKAILIVVIGGFVVGFVWVVIVLIVAALFAPTIFSLLSSVGAGKVGTEIYIQLLASLGVTGAILVLLLIIGMWILMIIFGIKMKNVSDLLNNKFPDLRFKTSGTLFKLGGWLSIILVGSVLIWIAWILYTIDFFSLPTS